MRKPVAVALLLFLALSLLFTYPLALHLGSAVEDRQDALLNVWITAWDGHQLLSDPLHLFDANIFYPYPRTLAYSELLLGNGLLALPVTAVTGNPVLGYNVALLLSFVLTALGAYLLVLELTRSPAAGLVAGALFAFSSYRMTNLAQAQLLTTQWLPLSLLALHRLVRSPRPRHMAAFALFFWLQAVSSFYYGMLLAVAVLVLAAGYAALTWPTRRARPASRPWAWGSRLLLAGGCALLALLPFALPYFQAQRELGFERSLAEAEPFSASLRQYATVPPGSLLYRRWLPVESAPQSGGYPADALFPGFVALALAGLGLARGRERERWLFLALLLAAGCLSLGPRLYLAPGTAAPADLTLPYAWLYAALPGFKALRAPVRFDALVTLALAVLAGVGTAGLTGPRLRRALPVVVGLAVLELAVWPGAHAERVPVHAGVPPVYRWLAEQAPRPVLELPMAFATGGPQLDYQYLSTVHWQPTPDGYSGFIPPKHGQIVYEMERFPSERSISLLQALGVEWAVIHTDRFPPDRQMALPPDLEPVRQFGADRVVRVRARAFDPADLEVSTYLPSQAIRGQAYSAYVIVLNRGVRSYAFRPTVSLSPAVGWGPSGAAAISADLPLVISPGGVAVIPVASTAPAEAGDILLTLGEPAGPIGPWRAQATVAVGEVAERAFPVPARLAAWEAPARARPGQPLQVRLSWLALGKIDAYYSVYVKLVDAQGNALAGWDGQPQGGAAPTLTWVPGEEIQDTVTVPVPADAAPGDYALQVGMYRAEDLARALTFGAGGELLGSITLGSVRVEP